MSIYNALNTFLFSVNSLALPELAKDDNGGNGTNTQGSNFTKPPTIEFRWDFIVIFFCLKWLHGKSASDVYYVYYFFHTRRIQLM